MTATSILGERLPSICAQVVNASELVAADGGASPVLGAVMGEFRKKAEKAQAALGNDEAALRDAVLDMEQAGDSAKAAAEADTGPSEATRQAVLDAHLAICKLKFKAYQAPAES